MLIAKIFSRLPFWFLYALSDLLAWLLHTVVRYRRKVVYDNIRFSFPDKPEAWHHRTVKAFYRSFTDTWLEALRCTGMSEADFRKRVQVENPAYLQQFEARTQSTLGLAGHSSNWEWLFLRGSLDVKNVMAVYLRVDNPFFDKLMYSIRNRFGVRLVEKAELLREVVRSRTQYRNIAMVADQAPNISSPRAWFMFMHRLAPFFDSGEKLARKENMPLYYVGIKKTSRGQYTIWYEELGQPPYNNLPQGELTKRYVEALENNIREHPELYLWSHKRWKHQMPAGTEVYPGE